MEKVLCNRKIQFAILTNVFTLIYFKPIDKILAERLQLRISTVTCFASDNEFG